MIYANTYKLVGSYLCCDSMCPQVILTRRQEVFGVECELSAVHGLLSKLPPELKYEQMIMLALQLLEKHPPDKLLAKKGNYKMRHRCVFTHISPLHVLPCP